MESGRRGGEGGCRTDDFVTPDPIDSDPPMSAACPSPSKFEGSPLPNGPVGARHLGGFARRFPNWAGTGASIVKDASFVNRPSAIWRVQIIEDELPRQPPLSQA